MAYIYKKVNSLITPQQPGSDKPGGESIVPDSSGVDSSPGRNPYASTSRNPQAILEANKNESMGGLQTGLQKSIGEQTQGMQKASQEYRGGLQNVGEQYSYKPEDISNVNQDVVYGKLAKVLTPQVQKAQLSNISSNTASYNPNTQGVQAASNPAGLSSLLRDQYGTTQGGSRLDALLYRGTGQAGQAIQQNLNDINQFRGQQQTNIGQEQSALEAAKLAADARAQQLSQELGTAGVGYKTAAEQAREAAQRDYDLRYSQEKAALENILASESGYNAEDLAGLKETIRAEMAKQGIQGIEAEKLLPSYIQDRMINVDVNQFIDPRKTFQMGEFLDPRYNKIQSLLNQSPETLLTPQELAISRNDKGLRDAIANAKRKQMVDVGEAVGMPEDPLSLKNVLRKAIEYGHIGTAVPDEVLRQLGMPTSTDRAIAAGSGAFNQIKSMF